MSSVARAPPADDADSVRVVVVAVVVVLVVVVLLSVVVVVAGGGGVVALLRSLRAHEVDEMVEFCEVGLELGAN